MNNKKKVYWINLNRFDSQPDKSTWIEMASALSKYGFNVSILTGYKNIKYQSQLCEIKYFTALDIGLIFRISLLFNILIWILRHGSKDNIYILDQYSLFMAPFLNVFGLKNIHLDIRSVHVDIHTLKQKIDRMFFWKIPMFLFKKMVKGNSFITESLRVAVENEFNYKYISYVIWESGVNTDFFVEGSSKKITQPSNKFNLFYHGSISENRGISRVVKAIKNLPESYKEKLLFTIVGDGSGLDNIKKIVKKESLTKYVKIKGMIPYENIPQEIAVADCCICPLPDRLEWNISSPLKVFEYMACNKPIILTPIPAHKNVLKHQNFIVWTNGDKIEDYVEAIKRAFDEHKSLKEYAKISSDVVKEKYDWLCQGKKLANYFDLKYR